MFLSLAEWNACAFSYMISLSNQGTDSKEPTFEQQGNFEHSRTVWFVILESHERNDWLENLCKICDLQELHFLCEHTYMTQQKWGSLKYYL